MGALAARPSVRSALKDIASSKRLPVVATMLFVLAVLGRFPNGWLSVLGAIASIFTAGYLVTYSRDVATGESALPEIPGFRTQLRRGVGSSVVLMLTVMAVALPFILVFWAAGPILESMPSVSEWLPAALFIVAGLVGVALMSPALAAYVHHDSVGATLNPRAVWAATSANRRAILVPVMFSWATLLIGAAALNAVQLTLGSQLLEGFPHMIDSLSRGQLNGDGLLILVAVVFFAAFSTFIQLVDSHLIGQYCALAYAEADDAVGWSA